MEAKVKITMEGEHLRDMKIFLGDSETEITTMVTRAEIIIDAENNRPIINLTLLPREIELPEHLIAAMQVERIHLMKPSERFARWRASRGKAIKGAWRRFVDRLPRKAPRIVITRPSGYSGVPTAPEHETSIKLEFHEDDGYGQPGELIDAGADGTVTALLAGLPDDEIEIVKAAYGESFHEAAERTQREVDARRQQRQVEVAHERELQVIQEQYEIAEEGTFKATIGELKKAIFGAFGIPEEKLK